jgi:hypothetical protein
VHAALAQRAAEESANGSKTAGYPYLFGARARVKREEKGTRKKRACRQSGSGLKLWDHLEEKIGGGSLVSTGWVDGGGGGKEFPGLQESVGLQLLCGVGTA